MQSELIYQKFLLKVNKGNSGGGITIDRPRFVLLFNECKNRWVERNLKNKDSILIDDLFQTITSTELQNPIIKETFCDFDLPDDYYQFIEGSCNAKRGRCKRLLHMREVKNQNKQILKFDSNQRPDFDYEWTFCSIQGGKIRIYRTDFNILTTHIEYYSVIPDIDIAGDINIDGFPTTNIPLDIISDQYIDQIVNLTAEEYMRDFQDPQNLALQKDRTQSEK